MRTSHTRFTFLTAAAGSILLLASCAPSSDPITGVGGDTTPTPTSSSTQKPNNTEKPNNNSETTETADTASGEAGEGAETNTDGAGSDDTSVEEGIVPLAQSGSSLIDPADVPLGGQFVEGYTSEQLQEAYAWAADRTLERYAFSNFWQPTDNRAEFANPAFFFITNSLTGDAEKLVTGSIASASEFEKNTDRLASLLPPPPQELDSARWLSPAVADWRFGEPVYTAGSNSSLQVAVPYSAVGVYEQSGSYYSLAIQDITVYTLTRVGGEWRIADWDSQPVYGQPEKLPTKPADRILIDYTPKEPLTEEELADIDIEEFFNQNN